jgi:acetyl esterase/lipase
MDDNRMGKRFRKGHAAGRMESDAEKRRLRPAMQALKALHSAGVPEEMTQEDLERQRRMQEVIGRMAAPMVGLSWEPFDLDGMGAAWMRLRAPHKRTHAVLYCHGGGYTSGNLGYSRVLSSKLTHVTGYDVLTFDYRLAPEHPYPAAPEDALRAWNHLMHLGYGARDVTVMGDSAGGNLALVLCRHLREQGRLLPASLVLLSPWTDMTASGVSYYERQEIDPMLTLDYIKAVREAYAGGRAYSDGDLSPLLGDLSGFPPTLIQVGTNEILYSDSERLKVEMEKVHVPCTFEVYEDMWHVFQMFPTRKSSEAMSHIGYFLLDQR